MIFANTDFVNSIIHILWQSIDITNTSNINCVMQEYVHTWYCG